jgi:signal transduction histidine kinase
MLFKTLLMKYLNHLILTTVFFLLITSGLYAQAGSDPDTTTILKLLTNSRRYRDSMPEKALQMINEALNKSKLSGYAKGEALAYARLGRWYFGSNMDTSISYARKALDLFDTKVTAPDTKADIHLLLAEGFDEQGRTDSSAYYYYVLGDEADAGNITKPEFLIEVFTKLAIFWVNIKESSNDKKMAGLIRGYIQKAKEISKQMKDTADASSSVYFMQGIYYHGMRQFDSSRYFYLRFIEARERIKNVNLVRKIATFSNIIETYLEEMRPNEALPYIIKVKELGNDPGQNNYLSFFMAFVGLQEGKALCMLKRYPEVIGVYVSSLAKLNTTGGHLRQEVVDAYKYLGEAYEATGDYKAALSNKSLYIKLYDSLSRKEKLDIIGRQEIRYRIAQKDKELIEKQLTIARVNEKVRTRNGIIAAIVALVLFLGLIFTMWRRRNLHKQKLQQQSIENLQQKIKIERLNATIAGEEKERTRIARELHDGIGGLITAAKMNFELAKNKTIEETNPDFKQGMKLLEEAGTELRQAARNLMPEVLLQEGLIKALQVFCERITEKSSIQINFQSFGDKKITDPNLELSVYRIIQELVHNIVKHSKAQTALVQVSFQDDGGMNITVEDDGIGMNRTSITHGTGMGMKNIQERIKETGGKLDIQTEEGKGTSVYIEYESQN